MHWEVGVKTGESCHKVVFPNANRTFCCILTMIIGWHKLELDIFYAHELLQCC
jgi:hypothetical protein